MRIAFVDFSPRDYKVESVYRIPVGGSESALCYLAEALATQGHDVFLLNNTSESGISCGVMCLPLSDVPHQLLRSLDVLIVLNMAGEGVNLRSLLGEDTRLLLWTGHTEDQPAVQGLQSSTEREVYDGIALVSEWQRDCFHRHFGIHPARTRVLRNAIGPAFCRLFSDSTAILPQKSQPPVLAYTSTPFRGLDILLEVFPRIRREVPGTRLKVFSSMKVYALSEADDESQYGQLYRKCRETEGVEYLGSLPQPELARELRSVMILAYPNTFAETSCIAVMEAMASGCHIVTSNLGALPETTAGFARLISVEGDWEAYKERFVGETVGALRECISPDTTAAETHLRRQVSHVNRSYTWSVRAQEWVDWLSSICAQPSGTDSAMPLESPATVSAGLQQQAYHCLIQGESTQAATLYEQAIEACPSIMSNYWYLGLLSLLQGQQVEAQSTWMLAMMNGEPDQIKMWASELIQVLQAEYERQKKLSDYQTAGLIQQCIREISSDFLLQ